LAPDDSAVAQDDHASPTAVANELPPLLLDDEPLLLLDDDLMAHSTGGPMADNSRCFVCHMNLMEEKMALTHAEANVGCADCHGDSDEHIADESWTSGGTGTAPDAMFTREQVNPLCYECHDKARITDPSHQEFLANTADEKYCTDCHGEHRLAHRITKWK
jgi:hypothetical protein